MYGSLYFKVPFIASNTRVYYEIQYFIDSFCIYNLKFSYVIAYVSRRLLCVYEYM
jgi:hypothetical protein